MIGKDIKLVKVTYNYQPSMYINTHKGLGIIIKEDIPKRTFIERVLDYQPIFIPLISYIIFVVFVFNQ